MGVLTKIAADGTPVWAHRFYAVTSQVSFYVPRIKVAARGNRLAVAGYLGTSNVKLVYRAANGAEVQQRGRRPSA